MTHQTDLPKPRLSVTTEAPIPFHADSTVVPAVQQIWHGAQEPNLGLRLTNCAQRDQDWSADDVDEV